MQTVIQLTDTERQEIYRTCEKAVLDVQAIIADGIPRPDLAKDLVGPGKMRLIRVSAAVVTAFLVYLFWRWLFAATHMEDILSQAGFPRSIGSNLPVLLGLIGAAGSAWTPAYLWGREGRLIYANQHVNAHDRAYVLYHVLEELGYLMPGAIPNFDEFGHDGRDDDPNPLIERALGRMSMPRSRATIRRPEPPLTASRS